MRSDAKLVAELIRRRDADELIADLSPEVRLPKPLSGAKIATVENAIGRKLPSLLVRIYNEVANGGFGDSYGLLGLVGGPKNEAGFDTLRLWKQMQKPDPDDELWKWREYLLPIGQLGCGMYHCIDCRSKTGKIVLFEPNPHCEGEAWDDAFFPFCSSLNKLFSVWLDGGDVWEFAGQQSG